MPRTIVFDLDDTLYSERDYVLSGKHAVREAVQRVFDVDVGDAFLEIESDFLTEACILAGLPISAKETLLWIYRTHTPQIEPRASVLNVLDKIRKNGDNVCILTDGRALTQRLKVKALQLDVDGVYVSEENGAEKPDPVGYQRIMSDFPADTFFYIGDNPKKDFIAPNKMDWQTIGIAARETNIHSYDLGTVDPAALPKAWFDDFSELPELLGLC